MLSKTALTEDKMKNAGFVFLALAFCAGAFAQTVHEGQYIFTSDQGAIVLAADASVAVLKLDSPYVMFMLYMGMKDLKQSATVTPNDVVMVYNDQEYKMPTVKELEQKYGGELINDMDLYRHQGKESLSLSEMRLWRYQRGGDFFPLPGRLAVEEGSMANNIGFKTNVYFKNPGFKKGDQILIKVRDKNKPDITGEVAVILK
jgi:hypothetical protein